MLIIVESVHIRCDDFTM